MIFKVEMLNQTGKVEGLIYIAKSRIILSIDLSYKFLGTCQKFLACANNKSSDSDMNLGVHVSLFVRN